LWSTGETASSITVTSGGTYTVTQTVNGCTSSSSNVIAAPIQAPAIPGVTAIDGCGSTVLTTDATGSILWSTGETTTSIVVLNPGNYTITQSNGSCTSAPATIAANPISVPAAPVVTVDNQCGTSVLTATGSNLQWSTSETGSSISVNSPGTYYVSQTISGCTSPSASIDAAPLSVPNVTFSALSDVCINDAPFTLSGGSPAGGNYSGTGVSSNTFDPSVAGYGTFQITYDFTDVNGCSASAYQPITVGCADLAEEGNVNFEIYPNPTNGVVNFVSINNGINDLKVIDGTGRVVLESTINSEQFNIDLSEHAEGVYTIMLNSLEGLIVKRIILTK
jgi:hypothetical protein